MWICLPSTPDEPTLWGPHLGQPILVMGNPRRPPRAAVIGLHGRGETAMAALWLHRQLACPDVIFVAPQAAHGSWYPGTFTMSPESNEPYLSSALALLARIQHRLAAIGLPPERTVWLGFSQGGCLVLEYVVRHPRRYGGVAALSSGLMGTRETAGGSLAGTPVFLGCSQADFHVPRRHVERTAQVLREMGGAVRLRLYPGLDHAVNRDEIREIRGMVDRLRASEGAGGA